MMNLTLDQHKTSTRDDRRSVRRNARDISGDRTPRGVEYRAA